MEPENLTDTKHTSHKEYRNTATINAVQINHASTVDTLAILIRASLYGSIVQIDHAFTVDTHEGTFTGKPGDWLAEGIAGERWIIDDKIFVKTYEMLI